MIMKLIDIVKINTQFMWRKTLKKFMYHVDNSQNVCLHVDRD